MACLFAGKPFFCLFSFYTQTWEAYVEALSVRPSVRLYESTSAADLKLGYVVELSTKLGGTAQGGTRCMGFYFWINFYRAK
jgi:hypothetical protein